MLILGDGLLGSEIIRQTNLPYISRKKDGIDFTQILSYYPYLTKHKTVLNAIGYTNTYDQDKTQSKLVNYEAVVNLVNACNYLGIRLIHISTDFVYANSKHPASENDAPAPANNWYSYYKAAADAYIEAGMKDYLICRCSFKPKPFPYPRALVGMIGNFDYVDVISNKILNLVDNHETGIWNVGTKTKTMYELAKETNPDILPLWDKIHPTQPINVEMDLSKLEQFERTHEL